MDIFSLDIKRIAKSLMTQARISDVTHQEAWNIYMDPAIKHYYTFEEIDRYIYNNLIWPAREGEIE